jgi:curved DNA-binding protein CbpA
MSLEPSDLELLKSVNLYEILGFVSKDEFTPELAKKSYRKLALKYHPDKNPNISTDKFEAIQLAYLILLTPDYKTQYDNLYDDNYQLKDFKDLISSYKSDIETIQFNKISEKDFTKQIHELNIKNGAMLDMLNQETATNTINKMIIDRNIENNEFTTQYKAELKILDGNLDQSELNKKFNKMFESKNDEVGNFDNDSSFDQTEMTVFNGCDILCDYTTLSNMDYNSMYASNSTYEQSFKINKVPKYVDDNRSIEDRMKDYLNSTDKLVQIAKKSTSSNTSHADFRT